MNRPEIWYFFTILSLFSLNVAFCGKSTIVSLNEMGSNLNENINSNDENDFLLDTGKILKRDKRYLLWTNGGISKVTRKCT